MKKKSAFWVAMISISLLGPSNAFATGDKKISVSGENSINFAPAITNGANASASVNGVNASSSVGDINLKSEAAQPLPGFVGLPANAVMADVIFSEVETAAFENGITMENIEAVIDQRGNGDWGIEDEEINFLVIPSKQSASAKVYFEFANFKKNTGAIALANGKITINKDNASIVMLSLARKALALGANRIQIAGFKKSEIKTKSRGVGIGGGLLCFVGINIGASGGSVRQEVFETAAYFTMWRDSEIISPPVVEPCDDCGDLSEVFADLAMWQKKISGCDILCANNLSYRVPSAECNIELYACLKKSDPLRAQKYLRAAQRDLYWALRNYEEATDTKTGKRASESLEFYKKAIRLQVVVLQAQGKSEEAQIHADKYHIEKWRSDFVPSRKK